MWPQALGQAGSCPMSCVALALGAALLQALLLLRGAQRQPPSSIWTSPTASQTLGVHTEPPAQFAHRYTDLTLTPPFFLLIQPPSSPRTWPSYTRVLCLSPLGHSDCPGLHPLPVLATSLAPH